MDKLLKLLVVIFLVFSSVNSSAQMKENVIILDDVTLHISDNHELNLDLKKSDHNITSRRIEIYQTLFDLPVVDSQGQPNGVILNWDQTEYSAKWFQNSGEYVLKIIYPNDRSKNKEVTFKIN